MDVGYARVSTLDQDPQIQIDALDRAGCWPIYREKVSGVAAHRPVRDETLRQLKPGDTLTVWKLDRLGRSVIELHQIVEDLEQRGVRFRCLTQQIDTTTGQGGFFFTLLAAFAELEHEMIKERTMAGKAARAARGEHPGGRRRYGFEPDHKTIVEEEAARLREAGRRLLAGEPASRIVDGWNDQGIPAQYGGRWQVTPLRNMLTNPRTAPILGQDSYERVRQLFRPAPARRLEGRTAEHLLSGILRCGREGCGQPMYSVHIGRNQATYRCRKSQGSGGRSRGCGMNNISERAADRRAAEAFVASVVAPEFTAALSQWQAELLAGEITVEQLGDWRAEIAELEQVLPTRFGTQVHRRRHDELQRLVRQATARLLQQPELQALLDLPKSETKLRARWAAWTIAERRTWLKRVVEYIDVKPATSTGRGSNVAARLDPRWRDLTRTVVRPVELT